MISRFTGSLRASFLLSFLLFSSTLFAQVATTKDHLIHLAKHDQWLALLHIIDNQATIQDPQFLLSSPEFNPLDELYKTVELLSSETASLVSKCRFLARKQFIQQHSPIEFSFDESQCSGYQEFLIKAPADSVSIIFASENLTQPSSMLGHSMLAISGNNQKNEWVEHGISFFTELDTINLARILWDTLYQGKKAHYVIEPLAKSLNYYLRSEQRNIWQYELALTQQEKSLLHKHLWELRDLEMDYFFHRNNCATFSFDVLRVVNPSLINDRQGWVTPIDVVKAAQASDMVAEVQVYPSSKWKVRMLTDFIASNELDGLEGLFSENKKIKTESILATEMMRAYNQYSLEVGDINSQTWRENQQLWLSDSNTDYALEMNHYKSPAQSAGDAAYHMTLENSQNEQWLLAGWLPTSHALEDDNRQFFGETELKLSEIVVRANLRTAAVDLYRWHIYSAKSLTPRNRFTGGLSGSFSFGFDQFFHHAKQTDLAAYVSGSLGITHKINSDMSFYYLANLGQVTNSDKSYAYAAPEIGMYVYEVFDMKSMLSLKREFRASLEVVNDIAFTQSFFLGSSAVIASARWLQLGGTELAKVGLQYKLYF